MMGTTVLFGASKLGRLALQLLAPHEKSILFCDNNQNLIGKKIQGIEVISPTILAKKFKNARIIITTNYHKEVSEQLKLLGIIDYEVFSFQLEKNIIQQCAENVKSPKINILSIGWPRSASSYLHGILHTIMEKASLYTSYRVESGLDYYTLNRDEVVSVQKDRIVIQLEDKENRVFIQTNVNTDMFLLGTSVVYSHLSPSHFYQYKKIWENVNHLFYVYRDIRDCVVSVIQIHTINDTDSPYGNVDKKMHGKESMAYYGICDKDLGMSSYHIYYLVNAWREHIYDFLRLSQMEKKVFGINYKDLTTNTNMVLSKFIEILGVEMNVDELYLELKEAIEISKFNYVKATNKFNKYQDFFSDHVIENMNNLAGDALCALGFMLSDEYSDFIAVNNNFHIIRYKDETTQSTLARLFFKEMGKKITNDTCIKNDDEWQGHSFDKSGKYIFFTLYLDEIRDDLNRFGLAEGTDYILYPYFKVFDDPDYTVFDVGTKCPVKIIDIGKSLLILSNLPLDYGCLPLLMLQKKGIDVHTVKINSNQINDDRLCNPYTQEGLNFINQFDNVLLLHNVISEHFNILKHLYDNTRGGLYSVYPFRTLNQDT